MSVVYSNANLFQKDAHILRDNVLPDIWTSLLLLKLAHTINHQSLPLQVFTIVEVIILLENTQVETLHTNECQREL